MSSKTFKLSALTALILGATNANAALYQVVEVSSSGEEAYGRVIQSADIDTTTATDAQLLGCFGTTCSDANYSLAGDTLEGPAGFSYRQETPFAIDNRFYYLDQDDLETYCFSELGYSTCESWAELRWSGLDGKGGLYRERQAWNLGTYASNASSFVGSTVVDSPDSPSTPTSSAVEISDSKNVVVNALAADGSTPIGNTSSGYYAIGSNAALMYRERGYYGSILLLPKQTASEAIVQDMGRSMAFGSFEYDNSTYAIGSAAVAAFKYTDGDKDYLGDVGNCVNYSEPAANAECQNFAFANKPFVWDVSGATDTAEGVAASLWSDIGSSTGDDTYETANTGDYSAQGSIRAAIVSDSTSVSSDYQGKPVMVGYNTDEYSDRLLMQAAIFYPNSTFETSGVVENAWSTTFIADATVRVDGDYIHSNSVAKDINNNLLVIGEAKRYGSKPESGAANNRLFIADANATTPTASFFSGGIFFTGAGGEANAINNFNEIVGQIDAEEHREVSGKARRKRGYIYPYNGTGTQSSRRSDIFNDQAWWLDDLTNGGSYSSANNHFRVINASDINDDGVISATALQCFSDSSSTTSIEYDSDSHNSYCGGGSGDERIVAVKLIPISGATSDDIVQRSADEVTVERNGAGIGFYALTLLTLISFRRKK